MKDETDYAGEGPHALGMVRHYRSSRSSLVTSTVVLGQAWSHDYDSSLKFQANAVTLVFGNGNVRTFVAPPRY